jgi:hypothetical protein
MNNQIGGTFDKIDAINGAYSQLRISGLTSHPTPEELETALDRLEAMAAEWEGSGICAGYNFEDLPDPNSNTNVGRQFKQAFETNLALRLSPDFGIQLLPSLATQAASSLSNLATLSGANRLNQVVYPDRMARGSGNTLRYNRWRRFYRQTNPVNSCTTNTLYIGDINNYVEHFDAYLDTDNNEVIDSFTIDASSGISIESSSNDDADVNYTVKATGANSSTCQVTIIMVTDLGRETTRIINFEVIQRPSYA